MTRVTLDPVTVGRYGSLTIVRIRYWLGWYVEVATDPRIWTFGITLTIGDDNDGGRDYSIGFEMGPIAVEVGRNLAERSDAASPSLTPSETLVAAAIDQPKPSPAMRSALNRVLALIGHPVAPENNVGKQTEFDIPPADAASLYAARQEKKESA